MIQQWDFPVDEPVSLVEWRQRQSIVDIATLDDHISKGESLRRVAAECGVSHETLRRWLQQAGVTTAPVAVTVAPRRGERRHRVPDRGRSKALGPNEVAVLLRRHRAGESIRSLAMSTPGAS